MRVLRAMKPVLHNFDYAYVINLDEDSDRMQRISSRLHKLNVPFERVSALSHCRESHAAVLRLILERGHDKALILEDDAVFRDDTDVLMKDMAAELAVHPWDIFYMGVHITRSGGRVSKHLGEVMVGAHTHAYAVSSSAVPRMLRHIAQYSAPPPKRPNVTFDAFRDAGLVRLYSIPLLAVQEPNVNCDSKKPNRTYMDRLPQYFSFFDGDDFENHCAEMKRWQADWRRNLTFRSAVARAERIYRSASLQDAASEFLNALREWPEAEAELRLQATSPMILEILNGFTPNDEELFEACTWLSNAIHNYLGRQWYRNWRERQ